MPAGRPTKIDAVIRTRPDGSKVTVADAIISALRVGDYLESAANAAGVHKSTVYGWLRIGADTSRRQTHAHDSGTKPPKPTAHERRCLAFFDAVSTATDEWHLEQLAQLESLARGGRKITKTTTKVIPGPNGQNTVETTTTVEEAAPDVRVLLWRLERRFPDRYGRRVALDLPLVDDDPFEVPEADRADRLVDDLSTFLQTRQADVPGALPAPGAPSEPIEANGRETGSAGV